MTAQHSDKAAVGRLTAPELARHCAGGETLATIAAAAGVSRQAVQQALKHRPELDEIRTSALRRQQRAEDFRRYTATRHGARLLAAAGEIRDHCPGLEVEWRRQRCAWALYAGGLRVSICHALRPLRFGMPGYMYLGFRVQLHSPQRVYLVRCGDGRRFVFVDPPAGTYVWWEAVPPWRHSQNLAPDFEWRGR